MSTMKCDSPQSPQSWVDSEDGTEATVPIIKKDGMFTRLPYLQRKCNNNFKIEERVILPDAPSTFADADLYSSLPLWYEAVHVDSLPALPSKFTYDNGQIPGPYSSDFATPSAVLDLEDSRQITNTRNMEPQTLVPRDFFYQPTRHSPQVSCHTSTMLNCTQTLKIGDCRSLSLPMDECPTSIESPEHSLLQLEEACDPGLPTPPETPSSAPSQESTPTEAGSPKRSTLDPPPYSQLIYQAMKEAPGHEMTLRQIYEWFRRNTDKAGDPKSTGWQNSIRHNLSMNEAFVNSRSNTLRPGRQQKRSSNVWALTQHAISKGIQATTRYRGPSMRSHRQRKPDVRKQKSGSKGGKASSRAAKQRMRIRYAPLQPRIEKEVMPDVCPGQSEIHDLRFNTTRGFTNQQSADSGFLTPESPVQADAFFGKAYHMSNFAPIQPDLGQDSLIVAHGSSFEEAIEPGYEGIDYFNYQPFMR